jgi:hypothetical protein
VLICFREEKLLREGGLTALRRKKIARGKEYSTNKCEWLKLSTKNGNSTK